MTCTVQKISHRFEKLRGLLMLFISRVWKESSKYLSSTSGKKSTLKIFLPITAIRWKIHEMYTTCSTHGRGEKRIHISGPKNSGEMTT
jgi:hypothetical protein